MDKSESSQRASGGHRLTCHEAFNRVEKCKELAYMALCDNPTIQYSLEVYPFGILSVSEDVNTLQDSLL
jgi:hypothetical protein